MMKKYFFFSLLLMGCGGSSNNDSDADIFNMLFKEELYCWQQRYINYESGFYA